MIWGKKRPDLRLSGLRREGSRSEAPRPSRPSLPRGLASGEQRPPAGLGHTEEEEACRDVWPALT